MLSYDLGLQDLNPLFIQSACFIIYFIKKRVKYAFYNNSIKLPSSIDSGLNFITNLFMRSFSIVIIFFELIIVIGGWKYKPDLVSAMSLTIDKDITNTHSIGYVLYTDYIHVFQLSGMILLVAMIGAIVLTFRQRSGVKRQSYFSQISRERSDSVELIDVESDKGVKSDD